MKFKYTNFRKTVSAKSLSVGFESIIVLVSVIALFVILAFSFDDGPIYWLLLPALACGYALFLELKTIFMNNENNDD